MTARHTQGEWSAVIYGGWDMPRIWGPNGSIALLQHQDSGPAEAEANARLIAASPKLLAACQTALPTSICLTNTNVPDDLVVPLDITMGELRKIAAAIAQATGTPA